jgi:rhomboid protease GluP
VEISPKWRWRLKRLQDQIKDWQHNLSQLWKGVTVQHKMCPECRGLIERDASACPLCGAGTHALPSGGLGRLLQTILPETGRYSMMILLVNFLLFAFLSMAAAEREGLMTAFLYGAQTPILLDFGANYGGLVLLGQIWRLITAIFLHIGILHLAFNSMALYTLGPQVEEIYGREKFLFLYLATGVAGNLASFAYNLFIRHTVITSAGASGALFGMIGVMAVYGHRRGGTYGQTIRRSMIQWALYGLVYGLLLFQVDNAAHIGGLITGAGLAFLISDNTADRKAQSGLWRGISLVCMAAIILSFVLALGNFGTAFKKLEALYGKDWWHRAE